MPKPFTRRGLLRSGAAGAVGLGGVGTAVAIGNTGASGSDRGGEFERIPLFDAHDVEFETVASPSDTAAGIRPGSQMFMHGPDGGELADAGFDRPGGCTANFIWREADDGPGNAPQSGNANVPDHVDRPEGDGALYIGAAGHCFLPGDAQADDAAARDDETGADVSDLRVTVCADCTFGGATTVFGLNGWGREAGTDDAHEVIELGEVVYARQEEVGGGSGVGHDFGLVRIPEEKADLVDPTLPQWGGPDGVSPGPVPEGDPIHQYGAGVANGEVFATKGSSGVSFGGDDDAWYAGIRASPGDSGSPIVASDAADGVPGGGAAAGVVTHLSGSGTAGTTMQRCKEMVADDIGLRIEVVQPGEL